MSRHSSRWNLQLCRISDKGYKAFQAGQKIEDNPYPWTRMGVQRQRHEYWRHGFKEAQADEPINKLYFTP